MHFFSVIFASVQWTLYCSHVSVTFHVIFIASCQLKVWIPQYAYCTCHMSDVIGVNRSMKREISIKQMNEHNRIINCTMVYREAIGYTNVHRKVFLDYPRIRCGGKHGQYFENARPYEESSSVFWSLYKRLDSTKSCPTGAVWIRSETWCCSGRPSTHEDPDSENPALSAKKADVSNLLFFKSKIILLYYIAIYGNCPEKYRL